MPSSSSSAQVQSPRIDRPLNRGYAPYMLTSEHVVMLPYMPDHKDILHAEIFKNPDVMKYFGEGKAYSFEEFMPIHSRRLQKNLSPQFNQHTGCLLEFTWTIITKNGIAGRFNIFTTDGQMELAFGVCPTQGGRNLARRAGDLLTAYAGEETSFIATAHPQNIGSSKSLERIRYPNGTFVFHRDPERQNVANKYGAHQPRDYFLSQPQNRFSFFSFKRGSVDIVLDAEGLQAQEPYCREATGKVIS